MSLSVIKYAQKVLGFKPNPMSVKPLDIANEFCEWARINGHEDLIYDLAKEIGK